MRAISARNRAGYPGSRASPTSTLPGLQMSTKLGSVVFLASNDIEGVVKSFLLGFREGSFDRKPKVKREIKKITTV